MSDVETEYANTEYQQTEYQGLDNGSDDEGREGEGREEGDELPVIIAEHLAETTEDAGGLSLRVTGSSRTAAEVTKDLLADVAGLWSELADNGHPTLPVAVVDVLWDKWAGWKASAKDQHKKHWRAIVQELCAMEVHKAMEKCEWGARLKVCYKGLPTAKNVLKHPGMFSLDAWPRPGAQEREEDQGQGEMDFPNGHPRDSQGRPDDYY